MKWAISRTHQTAVPTNEKTTELLVEDVERAVELYQYDPKTLSAPRVLFHSPMVVTKREVSSTKHAPGETLVGVVPVWAGSNSKALSFTASRSSLGNSFSPRDTRSQGRTHSI